VTLSHEELQSLVGPYALHALEPDEAEAVELHVEDCPRCRSELYGYTRAVPLLGAASGEAPAGLWTEIVTTIEQPGSLREDISRSVRKATRESWWRSPRLVAAAAVVIAALSVLLVVSRFQLNNVETRSAQAELRQAAAASTTAPGHVDVRLRGTHKQIVARVVLLPDGTAYLVSSSLPELGPGRTYQLWSSTKGEPVSLGVLGRKPELDAFRVEKGMAALMVTAEPSGGVPQPTSAVLARAAIPSM